MYQIRLKYCWLYMYKKKKWDWTNAIARMLLYKVSGTQHTLPRHLFPYLGLPICHNGYLIQHATKGFMKSTSIILPRNLILIQYMFVTVLLLSHAPCLFVRVYTDLETQTHTHRRKEGEREREKETQTHHTHWVQTTPPRACETHHTHRVEGWGFRV